MTKENVFVYVIWSDVQKTLCVDQSGLALDGYCVRLKVITEQGT